MNLFPAFEKKRSITLRPPILLLFSHILRFSLTLLSLPVGLILSFFKVSSLSFALSGSLFFLVFLYSLALWMCENYRLEPSSFTIFSGVILKSQKILRLSAIRCVIISQSPLCKLTHTVRITLVTSKEENHFYLKTSDFCSLFPHQLENISVSSGFLSVILASAELSRSLVTVITLIPVLRRLSAVIGNISYTDLLKSTEEASPLLQRLPPILSFFATAIFLLWSLGFLSRFLSLCALQMNKSDAYIMVKCGLLTENNYIFSPYSVPLYRVRKGPLTSLFRLSNTEAVFCARPHTFSSPLFLAKKDAISHHLLCSLSPDLKSPLLRFTVSPSFRRVRLNYPFALLFVSLMFSTLSLAFVMPLLFTFFLILSVVFLILFFFYACVLARQGVILTDSSIEVTYLRSFSLYTDIVRYDNISAAEIRTNSLGRRLGICTLCLNIRANPHSITRLRCLSFADARKISDIVVAKD